MFLSGMSISSCLLVPSKNSECVILIVESDGQGGIRHTVSICFRCFSNKTWSAASIFVVVRSMMRGWPLKLKFEKKNLVSGLLMGKCRCQGLAGQTIGGFPDDVLACSCLSRVYAVVSRFLILSTAI